MKKIDDNLLNIVGTMNANNTKIDCLVFAKNYAIAKKYLKRFDYEILEYPFIRAFGIKTNAKNLRSIASHAQISYISSTAKVTAQMDIAKSVINQDNSNKSLTGDGVTVAVIDTGISEHLDFCSFENRIIYFKDFISGIDTPYDDNGHGTFVCGVLAGNGFLSGKKYSGVAPKAKLIVLKALDSNGETGSLTILEAMQWIFDNKKKYNIRVVCMSLGSQPLEVGDPLMIGAESLWNSGIVVVAAAGNSGPESGTIKSPGTSGRIITVGSFDDGRYNDKKGKATQDNLQSINQKNKFKIANFSSRGPARNFYKPDCVAPGVDIVSTSQKDDFYTKMSGTSVSTPIVAGCCALLLQEYPTLSPIQVKSKILKSCTPFVFDRNAEGFGAIDVSKLCS